MAESVVQMNNQEKYNKAKQLIAEGSTVSKALSKAKLSAATFYFYKKKENTPTVATTAAETLNELIDVVSRPVEMEEAIVELLTQPRFRTIRSIFMSGLQKHI